MQYRRLGKTGLMVSEIGFGAEWMERHTAQECEAVLKRAEELGINILDCWMSEPNVRASLGQALAGRRERWYIQGHTFATRSLEQGMDVVTLSRLLGHANPSITMDKYGHALDDHKRASIGKLEGRYAERISSSYDG